MGRALELLVGSVANPGATVTALSPNSGDSFTVRSTDMAANIRLVQAFAFTNTNLLLRLRSPRMHDQAQNMRFQPPAALPRPLMPFGAWQRLYSQDPLTFEITGGGAETDIGALLLYYDNLPGVDARLHSWNEIKPLIANLTTIQCSPVSSGTAGAYGATRALNADFDTLVRNVDYAILGYQTAVTGATLSISGVDTGNLRLGGPLINQTELTDSWFVALSQAYGLPCIPVINSANVAGINLTVAAQATATTFNIGLNLAELRSGPAQQAFVSGIGAPPGRR